MKYVDEFRDRDLAQGPRRHHRREARSRAPLQHHGVLRRPHPCDLPLWRAGPDAGERALRAWAGLPGLRAAGRRASTTPSSWPSSHGVILVHLRRHDARARPRSARSLIKAKAEGADVRMVYSIAGRAEDRARQSGPRRWCSSPSASRPPTPPTAVAIKQAERRGADEFLGVLQPRADARRDPAHPGKPGGARARQRRDRRLPRAVACQLGHRQRSRMSASPRSSTARW